MKKYAKLSAREMREEEKGNGDEDLRRRSLLITCHRRFELSETEETIQSTLNSHRFVSIVCGAF